MIPRLSDTPTLPTWLTCLERCPVKRVWDARLQVFILSLQSSVCMFWKCWNAGFGWAWPSNVIMCHQIMSFTHLCLAWQFVLPGRPVSSKNAGSVWHRNWQALASHAEDFRRSSPNILMLQSPTEDFQKLNLDLAQSRSEMIWASKPSKPLPKATKPGVAHTVAVGYVRMNSDNEALCSNALANIPLKDQVWTSTKGKQMKTPSMDHGSVLGRLWSEENAISFAKLK